jgi:TolA-binding protein
MASELAPRAEDRMRNERAIALTMNKALKRRRGRQVRQMLVLAAAIVCVAGAAGAQLWTLGRSQEARAPELPSRPAVSLPAPPATAWVEHLRASVSVRASIEGQPPPRTIVEASETAAGLFAQANELRRAGNDDQAIALYRKLQRLFPGSVQAEQSDATLGQLLLQRSNVGEALRQFDRYLSDPGPLAEDVLVGRALSLRRLGRVHDERRTWEELLQKFPTSVHAARAKARLTEL